MVRYFAHFAAGLTFALGLALSQMTDPARVLAFLDVTGRWDPALALVMFGAISVAAPTFALSKRLRRPLLSEAFSSPSVTRVSKRLLIGASLFGIGWGLAGYCPGPALVATVTGARSALVFLAAMLLGFWMTRRFDERLRKAAP